VHERHRSPWRSPSRSPWRSSKCPKEKSLRTKECSIWPRANHRVGLERPHFWVRSRAQTDPRGRSSPQRDSFQGFPRARRRIPSETSEEGKNYRLHFPNCHFFTRRSAYGIRSQRLATTVLAKVTAQTRANWAGATPLFGGRIRPKVRGVTPALPRRKLKHRERGQQ
jgi:hypothetical protein